MKRGVKLVVASLVLGATLGASVIGSNASVLSFRNNNEQGIIIDADMQLYEGPSLEETMAGITNYTGERTSAPSEITQELTGAPDGVIQRQGDKYYYVINGEIQYNFTGTPEYDGTYWYVKNGVVDTSVTRFVEKHGEYYYFVNGRQDLSADKTFANFYGDKDDIRYIVKSKMDTTTTGFVQNTRLNNGKWYYIKNGKWQKEHHGNVCGTVNGVYGKYYVKDGTVQTSYTATYVTKDKKVRWYIVNGKVDEPRSELMTYSIKWVGYNYVLGGTKLSKKKGEGIDCSAFIQQMYAKHGVSLGRTTRDQVVQGSAVSGGVTNAKPGDLIYWSKDGTRSGVSHVAMYIGKNQIVHAANPRKGICIGKVYDKSKIYSVRRHSGLTTTKN